MATRKLIGTDPDQVPVNGDLGTLAFQDSESVRVTTFVADGGVGIGTSAPDGKLHVTSGLYPVALIERTSTSTNEMKSSIVAQHTTTGDMVDGFGADISFRIKDSSGVNNEIATFGVIRDGSDTSAAFKFMSRNSGTWSEKLRITAAGNVGIGTSAPSGRLHAFIDANAQLIFQNSSQNNLYLSGTNASMIVDAPNSSYPSYILRTQGITNGIITNIGGAAASGISLTNAAGVGIVVDASGNVGIGNTAPSVKLQVEGSLRFATDGSGANYLQFQRTTSNSWKLTSDGVGDIFSMVGNSITLLQDTTIQRGGLTVSPTLASAQSAINITQTWNSAATIFTLIKGNVTDTTSNTASLLMDLQTGGVSKAKISKAGDVTATSFVGPLTGNASTATAWQTARTLWGSSVNGSANITDPLLPAAGTVSLPAFSTSGDTNTGIFFPAADTIAFAEGGAEAMRIDAAGNLGVGTTSPVTYGKVDIYQATDPGTTPAGLSVRLQGVGGGTAVPQYGINVDAASYNGASILYGIKVVAAQNVGGTTYGVHSTVNPGNSTTNRWAIYGKANFNSAASHSLSTLPVGVYGEVENTTGATNVSTSAAGYFLNSSTLGSVSYGVYIKTTAGPTTPIPLRIDHGSSELMRIDSLGNLGIGTTSPEVPFHIRSVYPVIALEESDAAANNKKWWFEVNGGIYQARILNDAVNAASTWLKVTRSGTTVSSVEFPSSNVTVNTGNLVIGTAAKGIDFTTSGTFAIGGAEQMRLTATGLGIGTSSALEKLQVTNGNISIYNPLSTTNYLKFVSGYANNTTAYIAGINGANWGGTLLSWVGRAGGGSGAQYGTVQSIHDDPTGYPNQNTHLSVNVLTNTSNSTSILYVGTGSTANNTRTGLYVETGAVLAGTTGNVGIGTAAPAYKLEVNGSFAATTKSFVIHHPTKLGKKLRYGSLEGPENGVYIRGKIKGKVIELPEYWTKLVDPDTITVQLTAFGKEQKLFVKDIKDNKVLIESAGLLSGDPYCFYFIQAERVDVDKLQVEID